jgi:MFS family permease
MHVFVQRQVLFTNICALIAGFAMFGTFVLIPNFVESPSSLGYGFGASATVAGLYLLPSSITLLFAGPVSGLVGKRIGFKWILASGMLLVAIAAALLTGWHDEGWQILVATAILGIGVGFAYASMATIITAAVRATETGIATGMNTVMRTIGGVIGGQIGAAILTAHVVAATGAPGVRGYEVAFAIAAVAALVGTVTAVLITPRRPIRYRRAEALSSSPTD